MSNNNDEGLYDWRIIEGRHEEEQEGDKKKKTLQDWMQNTKCRIYNMYHAQPKDLPVFSNSDLWLLGVLYKQKNEKEQIAKLNFQQFREDFASRLWCTYRNDFPRLEPSTFTTDMGWGCMLRTGQMMLAQAFISHFLGRNWRTSHLQASAPDSQLYKILYRQILRWFAESPSPQSPYSIHQIVKLGVKFDYKIGECFGPTQIARLLKILVRRHSPDAITMYVPKDGIIYKDRVVALCQNTIHTLNSPVPASPLSEALALEDAYWRHVIILIPLRLGVEHINPMYIQSLKTYLQFPQSLGILGGKPNSAYYFIGYQDNQVLYLDPHIVQPAVRMDKDFVPETYHCNVPKKMQFEDMDPSLAVGFYCKSKDDFTDFCNRIDQLHLEDDGNIMFGLADTDPHNFEQEDEIDIDMVVL